MFRLHRNRKPELIKGSEYAVTNIIESLDVDDDSVLDFRISHLTKRDGEVWFETQSVWYGIDAKLADSYAKILKPVVMTNEPMKNLGPLIKHWKQLSKLMDKITESGLAIAKKLGES